MTKLRVLISDTFDPWFNLATEDYIFRDMDPEYKILFLWRNDKTVVIGKFQNPWAECNTKKMEEDGIKLARRQSGGGAVYHDLGNTNFTFLSSKNTFDKKANNEILTKALSHFKVEAFPSGRNDILVKTNDGDKKISGSAFKETIDRSFHHGTLLIDADMARLSNYLNPHPKKLESKGIASVRARVCNLKELSNEITHELLSKKIIEEFFNYYQSSCDVDYLDYEVLKNIPKLNNYYEKMSDWNWRFGESPRFTHYLSSHLSFGLFDVHLDVKKAKIEAVTIFSDSLYPDLVESLRDSLKNKFYTKEGLEEAKNEIPEIYNEHAIEFFSFLEHEIE